MEVLLSGLICNLLVILCFLCIYRILPAKPNEANILSNKMIYSEQMPGPSFACPDRSNPADCIANFTASFVADGQFTLHNTASYAFHVINEVVHAFFPGPYSVTNGCTDYTNTPSDLCSACTTACVEVDSTTDSVCTSTAPCSGSCRYRCPGATTSSSSSTFLRTSYSSSASKMGHVNSHLASYLVRLSSDYIFVFQLVSYLFDFINDAKVPSCGSVITEVGSKIQSINYPNSYATLHDCSWLVQIPTGYTELTLTFLAFDVEMCTSACM